jgi:replicative superfamily II helicase
MSAMVEARLQMYEKLGIKELWDWQYHCLQIEGVKTGDRNLVFATPTSSGKSLVAEILAISTIERSRGLVIWVAPFVSICQERFSFFQKVRAWMAGAS